MGSFPAFTQSISVLWPTRIFGGKVRVCNRSLHHGNSSSGVQILQWRSPRRLNVRMLGPFFPNLGDSKLLKSEIVRREKESLERDYFELAKLGQRYETFDRQGKLIFIDRAVDVVERFAVFLTRLKLSEDFSTQMFVKQYQVQLQNYGLTIDSLVQQTKQSLQMMKDDIPEV